MVGEGGGGGGFGISPRRKGLREKPSIGWLVALVLMRPARTADWPTLRCNVRCLFVVHDLCPFPLLVSRAIVGMSARAIVGMSARAIVKY